MDDVALQFELDEGLRAIDAFEDAGSGDRVQGMWLLHQDSVTKGGSAGS